MRILAALIFFVSAASAQAQFNPGPFINGIFKLIESEINKDNKVVLQDDGDQILLGRVFLDTNKEVDTLTLPACGNKSANKRVDRVRFIVRRNAAYIDQVRITFQNNTTQIFNVEDKFAQGETSGWVNLKGNSNRCIKRIRVTGEVKVKPVKKGVKPDNRAAVNFIGEIF